MGKPKLARETYRITKWYKTVFYINFLMAIDGGKILVSRVTSALS